ncbi:MAG TPA: hypothetical protein VGK58_04665, partial [Lacipirellulaceae bacterium]
WDAHTGEQIDRPLEHQDSVRAVAFHPSGSRFYTGSDDQWVQPWNVARSAIDPPWRASGPPSHIEFSSDAKSVLIQCANQAVDLWDAQTATPVARKVKFDEAQTVLASSPDRRTLLIRGKDGSAQLLDIVTGQTRGMPLRHRPSIMDAQFSGDGRTVVTAGYDQEVRRWDARNGTPLDMPKKSFRHKGIVYSVACSRDGRLILSGSDDQTARLWHASDGMAAGQPMQHSTLVSKVLFSPDERLALTIGDNGAAALWDVESCKLLSRPLQYDAAHGGGMLIVNDAQFSPDGSMILFRCADGTVRLYDVPRQLPADATWIRAWARAHSGLELDRLGVLRPLSQQQWLAAQQELAAMEDTP